MDYKKLLMPAPSQMMLFIVLLIFSVLYQSGNVATDATSVSGGFPLPFYTKSVCGDPCITAEDVASGTTAKISERYFFLNLGIDVIVLYMVSAILIFIYRKNRKFSCSAG